MVCPSFWEDYYMLIYTHCWELMNSVGSHGSLSLLFVMKVMVCHFVSDSHEVMTPLIVVLTLIVVVEISLQLHRSLLLAARSILMKEISCLTSTLLFVFPSPSAWISAVAVVSSHMHVTLITPRSPNQLLTLFLFCFGCARLSPYLKVDRRFDKPISVKA
jgi:hypothetical protein